MFGLHVNARKLAILLAGLILVAGGLYVGHRLQMRRQAQSLRERIDEGIAAGDDAAAIDALERYLAIRPADNGRLAQLARLLAARVLAGAADEHEVDVCRDVLRAAVARLMRHQAALADALDLGEDDDLVIELIGSREEAKRALGRW